MLVTSIFKAAGLEPEKVKAEALGYAQGLAAKIESMDNSLKSIALEQQLIGQDQQLIRTTLDMICDSLDLRDLSKEKRRAIAELNGGSHG